MEKLFENIYNESHIVKLNELTIETIQSKIKRAIADGDVAVNGTAYGKLFSRDPTANPLHPITVIAPNSNIEYFSKSEDAQVMNTKLAETFYKDVVSTFKNPKNQVLARQWFEAFYGEVKKAGVPFAPFTTLNVA